MSVSKQKTAQDDCAVFVSKIFSIVLESRVLVWLAFLELLVLL